MDSAALRERGNCKEGILRCRESGWHENHPGGDVWRQVGIGAPEADAGLLGSIGREATGGEELAEGGRKKHGSQGRDEGRTRGRGTERGRENQEGGCFSVNWGSSEPFVLVY